MDDLKIFYTEHHETYIQFATEAVAGLELSDSSKELLEDIKRFFRERKEKYRKGEIFYRATDIRNTPMKKEDFRPFTGNISTGRLDNEEQFFLYMSEKKNVCLYEKANPIDNTALAVAEMQLLRDQNLAYVHRENSIHDYFFGKGDIDFHHMMDHIFGKDLTGKNIEEYRPTQLISKALLDEGIEGVVFRSSKAPIINDAPPLNIVLFDRYAAEAINYEELILSDSGNSDNNVIIQSPSRPVA